MNIEQVYGPFIEANRGECNLEVLLEPADEVVLEMNYRRQGREGQVRVLHRTRHHHIEHAIPELLTVLGPWSFKIRDWLKAQERAIQQNQETKKQKSIITQKTSCSVLLRWAGTHHTA